MLNERKINKAITEMSEDGDSLVSRGTMDVAARLVIWTIAIPFEIGMAIKRIRRLTRKNK